MSKIPRSVFLAIAVLAAFSGCMSVGKPRGPVDAFVFSAGANPGLKQDTAGALNMRADPLEIAVVVPPGTDKRHLVATFSLNAEAAIAVISTGQRVVQENGATPNDFTNPVLYEIQLPKEKKPWRYRVSVREAETNARLAQLTFPEGSTLTPAFNPQVKSYTVVVPFATRQLRIGSRAESQYLKSISFDGAPAGGANAAGNVDFSAGQERVVLIETVAEDGVSRDRYTLTVRRGEPNRNSFLGALEAVEGTLAPTFSPQRTEYSLQVPFAATRVALRARSQSGLASLSLSTIAATGEAQERALLQTAGRLEDTAGASVPFVGVDWLPLILTVTAEDGSKRDYLVEVARAEPDHDNTLASLAVAGAAFSPSFASTVRSYVVRVPYATRQLAVTARPQSPVARAVLELASVPQGTPAPQGNLAAAEGLLVAFPAGDRMALAVTVTAQDGNTQRYLLDIRRQPPERNADLASLTPSAGSLVPAFNARIVSYTLRLPAAVEVAAFNLAAASRVATVSVEPPAALAGSTLSVPVAAGQSLVVNIMVTAEDGTQRLYRVGVTREGSAGGSPGEQSGGQTGAQPGDSRLAGLQLTGLVLSPEFDPAVSAYAARIPPGTSTVMLSVRTFNPKTLVTLDGQPLLAGVQPVGIGAEAERVLTLEVKAENGAATRYVIRLQRETAENPAAEGLLVSANNLKLGAREMTALAVKRETIARQGLITVRAYRSEQILAQIAAQVTTRSEGATVSVGLEERLGAMPAQAGKLVEIEVAIATSGGRSLCYTEARLLEAEKRMEVPFLLLADNPRLRWPAPGTPVAVTGYRSLLPAGKILGGGVELEKNAKGEVPLSIQVSDSKTGAVLGQVTALVKPGPGRLFYFDRPLQLPEGTQVSYSLAARARGGKIWQATGTAQVWTTAPAYDGGFQPVVLTMLDELR